MSELTPNFYLTASNFELEDIDESRNSPCIKLVCVLKVPAELNGALIDQCLFTMIPECGSGKWRKLVAACENSTDYTLDWGPSNGDCRIAIKGATTEFCVAKYGDGRGGSLNITVPTSACYDAFVSAMNMTADWTHR